MQCIQLLNCFQNLNYFFLTHRVSSDYTRRVSTVEPITTHRALTRRP